MKKSLLTTLALFAFLAGGNSLMAQWAQYNCDALPGEDDSVPIRDAGSALLNGTSEIVVDDEDATNNWWKFNVDLDAADLLKYNWYPSYVDPDGEDPVYVPAPMTIAGKYKWIDTTNFNFGSEFELRGFYKVQAKVIKENGRFLVRVKDWSADSSYMLPETFMPTEWHVLRLTENNGTWALYVNEDETALATGECGKSVDKHLAILGAYAENGQSGSIVDWIGLIEDEAAGPAETALPDGIFTPPSVSVAPLHAPAKLEVYPNPASETLTISVGSEMIHARYELFSITGQMVQDGIIGSTEQNVDLSSFQSGMYILKLDDGANTGHRPFIIK